MELDDMKNTWQEYGRKLDSTIRLNRNVRESAINKASTALTRLSRLLFVELSINAIALILLGMFLAGHATELKFFAPALALHVLVILMTISGIHQLVSLGSIDYNGSVLQIQKKLETLRAQRILATKWVLLLAPLAWVPLMIVGLKGLFEVDAYGFFASEWIVANLIAGLAAIPVMLWAAKRFAARMEGTPALQRLMNDIAGHNLMAATTFLNELSQFEKQDQ